MAHSRHHHKHLPENEAAEQEIMDQFLRDEFAQRKRLLNPVERISEILFGLIMALTFTCTISVAETDRAEVKHMLYAALSCNIAWGLVDAVMYVLGVLADRGHNKKLLEAVRKTHKSAIARKLIADAIPPVIAGTMDHHDLEKIRKGLLAMPDDPLHAGVNAGDFKTALGIFLLVFLSTVPVAIPFALISDPNFALRISNLVAILLMFTSGWLLASYGGYNKLLTSLVMTFIGAMLVLLTIALGG
jgi:hypothetical protein